MIFDMPSCGGCRTCELACSFHHKKEYNPAFSSIKVLDKKDSRGYRILFVKGNEGINCDGCKGCPGRDCLEVCEKQDELEMFINTFLKEQNALKK